MPINIGSVTSNKVLQNSHLNYLHSPSNSNLNVGVPAEHVVAGANRSLAITTTEDIIVTKDIVVAGANRFLTITRTISLLLLKTLLLLELTGSLR